MEEMEKMEEREEMEEMEEMEKMEETEETKEMEERGEMEETEETEEIEETEEMEEKGGKGRKRYGGSIVSGSYDAMFQSKFSKEPPSRWCMCQVGKVPLGPSEDPSRPLAKPEEEKNEGSLFRKFLRCPFWVTLSASFTQKVMPMPSREGLIRTVRRPI